MDVANVALLITAVGGFVAGGGGLIVGFRGQNKTDNANQLASLLSAYDEIVANLRDEVKRVKEDFTDARTKLEECENRCKDCQEAMDKLEETIRKLEKELELLTDK